MMSVKISKQLDVFGGGLRVNIGNRRKLPKSE